MGNGQQSSEANESIHDAVDDAPRPEPQVRPQHQAAENDLREFRAQVQQEFAGQDTVLELSDEMMANRAELSDARPEMDNNQYRYAAMRSDAADQFRAAAEGRLDDEQARDVPAASAGGFVNQVMTDPPESAEARRDAVVAVVTGAGSQMTYGSAPGNPFTGDAKDELPPRINK